jgi:ABC-type multidrug transport system permease subunit
VKAFLVLFRLRTLDVMRSGTTFVLFMALPLVLLGVVAIVFANGHPFERKEVLIVGDTSVVIDSPEIRIAYAPDEATARRRVGVRMASAYVTRPNGVVDARARVVAGPRDALFAKGLASELGGTTESMEVPKWGYVHYLFPGLLTFSVLLAGLFGMGYGMVRFRATLLLKKLATTPLKRSTFVGAQLAARTALVLVQLVVMIAVGVAAFGLPMSAASAAWLVVVTVLGLVVFMGAGFALACAIKSESLIVDAINALSVPLVFFSEIFFPLSELPSWLGTACALLPSTAMVRLTREVILFGVTDAATLAPGLLQLGLWAIVMYGIAILLFRWHR